MCHTGIYILLKKGNHDMLYIGRLRTMATEIFKALHGSTLIYIRELFEEKDKKYIFTFNCISKATKV